MKISDLLKMSFDSLLKRKVRTVLTVLGVIIGTISIVVMMSLGIGMKKSMMDSVESYASLTAVTVEDMGRYGGGEDEEKHLDDKLVEELSYIENVECVIPQLSMYVYLKSGKYEGWVELTGISPEGFEKMKVPMAEGEFPTDTNEVSIVYGNQVLSQMYNPNQSYDYSFMMGEELPPIDLMNDPVATILDTDNYYGGFDENGEAHKPAKKHFYQAAGLVAGGPEDYNTGSWNMYCNMDALKKDLKKEFKNRAVPDQPVKKNGKPYKELFYSQIIVYADSMENVNAIQNTINDMGYNAYSDAEWIEQEMKTVNLIQTVLGAIGAVSLLVAAIGIANTMMMSIYERTKEIGIMKVIGCNIRDIQALFLLEAGYIGLIGGTVGLALSYLLSFGINRVLGQSEMGEEMGIAGSISVIPPWLAIVAIIFAIVIGMISGFFPSLRAMKLTPLTAIRNE